MTERNPIPPCLSHLEQMMPKPTSETAMVINNLRNYAKSLANDSSSIIAEDAADHLEQLCEAAIEAAREALSNASAQFKFYADQHMAKSPPDTAKAKTNHAWMEYCEYASNGIVLPPPRMFETAPPVAPAQSPEANTAAQTAGDAQKAPTVAYFVATHHDLFRPGEPALILGVVIANNRPCFRVQYADGIKDDTPIENEDWRGKGGLGLFYEIRGEP